ncbi:arsenate reductase/protein-tyrosine-phosphatase family protein [Leucobacter musarum]|uniref:arsenate reductase/protein-tyrosine-phosphatase family protein n=1 Tax=Leucobacter musarum TaxID=1930747 RepID=UPI0006A7D4E6|nr:hypothetical protein [Leucobacter musarum]
MSDDARVLIVCTANLCRSPYVEARLRAALDDSRVHIESAGTRAMTGAAMSADSATQLRQRDIEFDVSFAARQVTTALIERATLVLTMTRTHRAQVLELAPLALKRTLTLREFAGLLEARASDDTVAPLPSAPPIESSSHDAWAALVRDCISRRSRHPELVSSDDADLADPYGLGPEAFATMARTVEGAVDQIVHAAHHLLPPS